MTHLPLLWILHKLVRNKLQLPINYPLTLKCVAKTNKDELQTPLFANGRGIGKEWPRAVAKEVKTCKNEGGKEGWSWAKRKNKREWTQMCI